jgi:hypothetical protein
MSPVTAVFRRQTWHSKLGELCGEQATARTGVIDCQQHAAWAIVGGKASLTKVTIWLAS